MTDEPEEIEDEDEPLAEQETPVEVGPGCFCFRDWDFLDPASEVVGLIGVQVDADGGVWRLMGSGEGLDYAQTWEKIGAEVAKKRLRPVN
jgi:hypothetical protein